MACTPNVEKADNSNLCPNVISHSDLRWPLEAEDPSKDKPHVSMSGGNAQNAEGPSDFDMVSPSFAEDPSGVSMSGDNAENIEGRFDVDMGCPSVADDPSCISVWGGRGEKAEGPSAPSDVHMADDEDEMHDFPEIPYSQACMCFFIYSALAIGLMGYVAML